MGIIQRQGIKDSIVTYFGVGLGVVNTLFIYTLLPKEVLGIFQFLISAAMIVAPFMMLGVGNLAVRYFPIFRDEEKGHHGFLFFLLIPPVIGFTVLTILVFIFQNQIVQFFTEKSVDPLILKYGYYVVPLLFFVTFSAILIQYTKNFLRIVIPTLLENVWIKIATGAIALLFVASVLNLQAYLFAIVAAYGVTTLGILLYLRWLGQWHVRPDFSFLNKKLMREMRVFAFYGVLGSIGGSLMTWLDRLMIGLLLGTASTGIFSIVAYIGTTIDIPRKSLEKIMSPIIADAIQREDWGHVADLYQRSSINLLIAGCFIFLGVWLNIDSLFDIMTNGDEYRGFKMIVLLLGFASIIDMVTSINTQIIGYSKYFRFNFYLIVILAGLNVVFNYLFISTLGYGIYGAAMATLASITIYNVVKFFYILVKLHIQPFTWSTLWIVLLALAVYGLVVLLPSLGHPLIDIAVKSMLITVLFISPVLYFKFSPDLNSLAAQGWQKVRGWLNF